MFFNRKIGAEIRTGLQPCLTALLGITLSRIEGDLVLTVEIGRFFIEFSVGAS